MKKKPSGFGMSEENASGVNRSTAPVRMLYRGSMPRPQKEHGEEMLGGIVQGRTWTGNGWEYRIIHETAGVLYAREP